MNEPLYECSRCGASPGRDGLTVKKVSFMEMGTGARTLRSRVTDWLCDSCLQKDEDYNREPFHAPGTKRVPLTDGGHNA